MSESLKKYVQTGDFCEIHLIKNKDEIRTYQSRVELIEDDGIVFVYIPTFKTKMVKLPVEANYDILFKTDKIIYKYSMNIVGYAKLDGQLFMKIKLTSSGEKVQRRKYYRLDLNKSIYLKVPNYEQDKDKLYISEVRDISAGGLRFVSPQRFGDITDIFVNFVLGTDFYVLQAKIINSKDISEFSDKFKVEYRTEFVDVSNYDREKIVSHIFEAQRNKLNRTYGR